MRKTMLIVTVVTAIAALTACGGNKTTPTAGAPSEAVTPTVTEAPTPTETPTPSPIPTIALPEGFPEDISLEQAPKYTEEELKMLVEETALATDRYIYKETVTYAEALSDWEYTFGFDLKFDKKEIFYDADMREENVESTWPDAVIYYLDGKEIASVYHNAYGQMAVHEGKKEIDTFYEEKDEKGRTVYCQTGERYIEPYTSRYDTYDEQGRLIRTLSYNSKGYLNSARIKAFNENGDTLYDIWYTGDLGNGKSTAYYESLKDVYTYDGNGNRISQRYKYESTDKTYTTVYEKDSQGRIISAKTTRAPDNSISEERLYYNTDGSVLNVMIDRYEYTDGVGNVTGESQYMGRLYYPSEENQKRIDNGLIPEYYEEKDKEIKYGVMEEVAEGKYEFSDLYFESRYNKDGLQTHYATYVKDSFEVNYEYNAKKQLTRVYRVDGIEGIYDIRYTYDAKGNVITETTKNGDRNLVTTINYSYDGKGNRVGTKRKTTYKGKVSIEGEWKYDETGFPVSAKVTEYMDGKVYVKTVGERLQ